MNVDGLRAVFARPGGWRLKNTGHTLKRFLVPRRSPSFPAVFKAAFAFVLGPPPPGGPGEGPKCHFPKEIDGVGPNPGRIYGFGPNLGRWRFIRGAPPPKSLPAFGGAAAAQTPCFIFKAPPQTPLPSPV
jgi:hypothetical protein